MMTCEIEMRTATVDFTFSVCTDHGHASPAGGSFNSGGVPPQEAVAGLLSVIEQIMAQFIAGHDDVREYLAREYGGEVLSERAQFRIMRMLANTALAQQVSQRAYYTHGSSALLSIPLDGGGDGS